jgi:hypothetical protein
MTAVRLKKDRRDNSDDPRSLASASTLVDSVSLGFTTLLLEGIQAQTPQPAPQRIATSIVLCWKYGHPYKSDWREKKLSSGVGLKGVISQAAT